MGPNAKVQLVPLNPHRCQPQPVCNFQLHHWLPWMQHYQPKALIVLLKATKQQVQLRHLRSLSSHREETADEESEYTHCHTTALFQAAEQPSQPQCGERAIWPPQPRVLVTTAVTPIAMPLIIAFQCNNIQYSIMIYMWRFQQFLVQLGLISIHEIHFNIKEI